MIKKVLLTIFTSISLLSYSQDSYQSFDFPKPTTKIEFDKTSIKITTRNSSSSVGPSLGLGMMAGGGAFILAGALTPPVYVGGSTTEKKPFYSQPKFYPLVSGGVLLMVGVVISLGN